MKTGTIPIIVVANTSSVLIKMNQHWSAVIEPRRNGSTTGRKPMVKPGNLRINDFFFLKKMIIKIFQPFIPFKSHTAYQLDIIAQMAFKMPYKSIP